MGCSEAKWHVDRTGGIVLLAVLLSACGDDSGGGTPTNTPRANVQPSHATATPNVPLAFVKPVDQQLSLAGSVDVAVQLAPRCRSGNSDRHAGRNAAVALTVAGGQAQGTLAGRCRRTAHAPGANRYGTGREPNLGLFRDRGAHESR